MSAKPKQARYFGNDCTILPPADGRNSKESFASAAHLVLEVHNRGSGAGLLDLGRAFLSYVQNIEDGLQLGHGIHGAGVYTGSAGIAYMYLRMAESLQDSHNATASNNAEQPLHNIQPKVLLTKAQQLLQADHRHPISRSHVQVQLCRTLTACMIARFPSSSAGHTRGRDHIS